MEDELGIGILSRMDNDGWAGWVWGRVMASLHLARCCEFWGFGVCLCGNLVKDILFSSLVFKTEKVKSGWSRGAIGGTSVAL